MSHLRHLTPGRALLCAALALTATQAPAQPFADADSARVDYRRAEFGPSLSCEDLEGLDLHEVTALSTREVPADGEVPAHCRVDGTIAPEITFQVNLPLEWNARFYMIGNGGHAGQQPDSPLQAAGRDQALEHHFAVAATDTGHDADEEPGASFVMSDPRKAIDYAYRAVHRTAVTGKAIANQFYGRPVNTAYWNSCSNGGRQGLIEAQRYPDDFDGIIANAPWVDQTGFTIGALWNQRALDDVTLTPGKLALLAEHVMAKCDALDGLEDGLIAAPRRCDIDVADDVPACEAGRDGDSCLTDAQAGAIQKIYDGPRDSDGKQLFPGFLPGSEALVAGPDGTRHSNWLGLIVPAGEDRPAADFGLALDTMRYLVFQPPRPDWDHRGFDFDRDTEQLQRWGRLANAKDIDLREFREGGGKLLMTYGWADSILQPEMGVNYYEKAVTANGPDGEDFMRLFMAPGMAHCSGGIGPDRYDAVSAVIDWVEADAAPQRLEARRVVDDETTRSRPLCPYPEVARYRGEGSIDEAGNFTCEAP